MRRTTALWEVFVTRFEDIGRPQRWETIQGLQRGLLVIQVLQTCSIASLNDIHRAKPVAHPFSQRRASAAMAFAIRVSSGGRMALLRSMMA